MILEEISKGCSTFEYDSEFEKGSVKNVSSPDGNYDMLVCKQFCNEIDCNVDHVYCSAASIQTIFVFIFTILYYII